MFYGFNAVATEIVSDAAWIAGENALISVEPRKVILNGGDGFGPAYDGAFLENANVAGANHEGCFNAAPRGKVSDASGVWRNQADGLLADLPFRKYSVCMMNGQPTPANRLYAMASWWLTYDPNYSVIAPIAPAADGNALFAEYDIVPFGPKTSATGGRILTLERSGVYVREFAQCFQNGMAIGACAAVVNPASSPRAVPSLSGRYTRALALNDASAVSGGRALWRLLQSDAEKRTPDSVERRPGSLGTLGPVQALILKQ
jgi:hypothetical protein